jgi:hemolysin activation/secretion protein
MRPLLAILLSSVAHGQFLPGIDPRLPESAPVDALPPVRTESGAETDAGEILCQELKEIRLESWTEGEFLQLSPGFLTSSDLTVPSPVTLAAKLARWRGQPLGSADLVAIADTILIHYDVEGFPVVGIDAPEQDFQSGTLRLRVEIGRIGKIGVTRPKYGSPNSISAGLKLRRGEILRRAELDEQLSWYGRTIFRKPQLLVSPGDEPATADLLIALAEKKPWRATIGYQNSGPELLGSDRFLFGVAGMTPHEHILAWQTVVGAPVSSLHAHALSWEIPFQKIHQSLQIDAVYADVRSISLSSGLPVESTGTSWSVAAMQKMALPSLGKWNQRLNTGLELKSTDQFVLFGGQPISPGEVRLVDAKSTYNIGRNWEDGAFSLDAIALASPGGLIDGNDDADFRIYDPQADATYLIGRLAADGWWSPGRDWRIALRGSAQISDSRLLPVEQFAVGGYQTVRGVAELEFYADQGWQSSVELYTPAIRFRDFYQMRLLGFFDQAVLRNRGNDADSVSGAGVGLRIQFTEHFDLRFDQGWRLDADGSQTHIGLQFAF